MTALLFRSTAITAAVLALAACGPAPDSGNRTTDTVDEERSLRTESPQAVAEFEDGIAGGIAVAPTIVAGEPMPMPLPPPQYDPFSEQYEDVDLNPVHLVSEDPVSTFSSDVDTAAYANVRRYITDGQTPPRDAVRIEEMINYFDYDYAGPEDAVPPFAATVAVAPTPWNEDTQILHIGIQGYDIDLSERPRANLVFLVDVSGSMEGSDRLPLLQQSLRMLTEQLQDDDTVSIVTYAGGVRVVLEPTPGSQRNRILAAIDHLQSGGSTAGAAGIEQAYELARRNFDEDAVNRVILGTDGDFNVGI
ncbi:MAG: von Willebrand factor type A domain-containing protein, partial [Rhodospirillaceae bacterium]|nr:von Willebrand factor type A domain-containing protein [Rhodospirillaceae bacterium]